MLESVSEKTIHILLVEDSESHVAMIREQLKAGSKPMKLTVARSLAEARASLTEFNPDLALIALLLPDGRGTELLSADLSAALYPAVIMASQADVQVAVEVMKAGALDYVVTSAATLADMSCLVERTLREWTLISERRQAELALREREQQFRYFFESTASGMAIVSLEGKILKYNPTFCRLSGYSEAELLNKNVLEVTHPEDRQETQRLYHELLAGRRKVIDYEKRYLRKDGSVIWGQATVAAVFGPNKDQLYYAATVKDITERKQAVNLLRESQQKLQLVLDNIPQYVFWKDRDSVYQGCNQNFARAAGMDNPEDIVGKTDYDLPWKKEESDFYRQCDKKTMKTDTAEFHIIEGQLQADGKQAWVDTNKVPLHDSEGNVAGILGTYEDITRRKQAEEALQESETRFRSLFEAAASMFTISPEGRFLSVNKAFCDFLGYPENTLLDLTVDDITHPDDRNRTAENYRNLLGGRCQSIDYEKRFLRQDGNLIWGHASVASVPGVDLKPMYYVGMVQDITERKSMEERLTAANRELEAFVYTVSHDLRSPLTAIIGYADFLPECYRDQLDGQALDCLAEISASGYRMLALMEDLLTLATVGLVERPAEPIDSTEVVHKVIEGFGTVLASVGAVVQTTSLPSLRVPETLLGQIFDNLIGNAIRYGAKNGDTIEVGGERRENRVLLFVRDHGPGILKEDQERLFDVFFRGKTAKNIKGTGVGLATVQKIAQTYGGRAWVEETDGGGSTFWVEMVDVETAAESEKDTL